jgi:putative membrane protein insertion efficiency factor
VQVIKKRPNILSYFLIAPIFVYRWIISPILHVACRYQPTCSAYAIDAIKSRGPLQGTALAVKRITSCHPWGGHGFDPVPDAVEVDKNTKQKTNELKHK